MPGILQKRIDRSPSIWPVVEKIPLLIIAVIFCILTVWGHQYEGAVLSFDAVPLMGRIANAFDSALSDLTSFASQILIIC
ncbi:MAG: hypothetical protein ACMUIM_04285 [bacterium]